MPIDWILARRGKILRRALPKSSGNGTLIDGLLAPNAFGRTSVPRLRRNGFRIKGQACRIRFSRPISANTGRHVVEVRVQA